MVESQAIGDRDVPAHRPDVLSKVSIRGNPVAARYQPGVIVRRRQAQERGRQGIAGSANIIRIVGRSIRKSVVSVRWATGVITLSNVLHSELDVMRAVQPGEGRRVA